MRGETLAEYPSHSKPGQVYEIVRGHDGVTYCTCWQWKLNRTCSHLKDYLSGQHKYKVRTETVAGKKVTYLELEEAINKAVQELS